MALNTLHSKNIIYRDLKPDNLMIDNTGHVKLIDFGFAKQLSQSNDTRTYTNCGTLGYTAPEVISGRGYSYPADLWSFGIVLAELLTG
jgi:serine/threonine protein kinase